MGVPVSCGQKGPSMPTGPTPEARGGAGARKGKEEGLGPGEGGQTDV